MGGQKTAAVEVLVVVLEIAESTTCMLKETYMLEKNPLKEMDMYMKRDV